MLQTEENVLFRFRYYLKANKAMSVSRCRLSVTVFNRSINLLLRVRDKVRDMVGRVRPVGVSKVASE